MSRDYDVIVIGSGAAGLAAAVTAHDAGASVIVLEADNIVGGSSRLSGGHFYAAGTRHNRRGRFKFCFRGVSGIIRILLQMHFYVLSRYSTTWAASGYVSCALFSHHFSSSRRWMSGGI